MLKDSILVGHQVGLVSPVVPTTLYGPFCFFRLSMQMTLTTPQIDTDIASQDASFSQTGPQVLLTADQMVKCLFGSAKASDRGQIVFAIEQLTLWSIENGVRPRHDSVLVAREVGDSVMPSEQFHSIVARLRRTKFVYEWVYPQYKDHIAGFKLVKGQALNEVLSGGNE